MRVHLDALYTYDAEGRMSHVNEARGPRAPRVFLGRTPVGHEMRSRADVPESTLASIRELVTREPSALPLSQRPHCGEAIVALLERDDPVVRVWYGPAYRIEVDALPATPLVVRVTHGPGAVGASRSPPCTLSTDVPRTGGCALLPSGNP